MREWHYTHECGEWCTDVRKKKPGERVKMAMMKENWKLWFQWISIKKSESGTTINFEWKRRESFHTSFLEHHFHSNTYFSSISLDWSHPLLSSVSFFFLSIHFISFLHSKIKRSLKHAKCDKLPSSKSTKIQWQEGRKNVSGNSGWSKVKMELRENDKGRKWEEWSKFFGKGKKGDAHSSQPSLQISPDCEPFKIWNQWQKSSSRSEVKWDLEEFRHKVTFFPSIFLSLISSLSLSLTFSILSLALKFLPIDVLFPWTHARTFEIRPDSEGHWDEERMKLGRRINWRFERKEESEKEKRRDW